MPADKKSFGFLPDGREVFEYTLRNANGITLCVLDYGCTIRSILTPDQNGRLGDIVLGFDTLEGYLSSPYYFGGVIGRCANRIANSSFELDGVRYDLSNQYQHHLHGGRRGFDKVIWDAHPFENENGVGIDFYYRSPDGEEGYPGNLDTYVRYYLIHSDALIVNFLAKTDKPTIVNLTQHSYFNLDGGNSWALNHALFIAGDSYLPIDVDRLPLGHIEPVSSTPFDFYDTKIIQDAFQWDNPQIKIAGGIDHSFVLLKPLEELGPAAALYGPESRRSLEVHTTEPALHVFTGNSINGSGKYGIEYKPYAGIALETQHFPDAPHHPAFPSIVVRPEKSFESTTLYKFGTMR